jgi:cell division protein FtsW (lipid II flippase)
MAASAPLRVVTDGGPIRAARRGPTEQGDGTVGLVALALALLDTVARVLIASRVGSSPARAALAFPVAYLLAYFALGAARLARPDGLMIAVPFVGLLTVGDVVGARLAEGEVTLSAELPALCAVGAFVVTLVVVRGATVLERAGELLGVAGAVLIALPLAPGIGQAIGGQAGWIVLGGLQVAPAELGRPLVLLGVAAALARLPVALGDRRGWRDMTPAVRRALFVPAIAVGIHVLERDLGSALLLALAVAGLISVATGRPGWFAGAVGVAAATLTGAALVSSRLQGRLLDVVHPLRLVDGAFDQAGLAHLALAWGGWQGVGFGGGLTAPRHGYVPAAGSDYVLAQWALEAGLVGLILAMALFAWLLATSWTWTLRAPDGFARYAAAGLTWLLTVSVVWTTGAVLGVLPLSGLPSPFIAGASNATGMAIVIGLLCRTSLSPVVAATRPPASRPLLVGRLLAVAAVALIAGLAIHRIDTQRLELNRMISNPWRQWSTLNRGELFARGGQVLAQTTGAGSLDTVARRYRHTGLTGGLVGNVSFANQDGGGIESSWRAVLRCGGSGQAEPAGPAWSRGATVVSGDPSRCRPASLALSIDLRLERAAQSAIRGRHGAVVVLDARTGAVLAAAGHLRSTRRQLPSAAFDLLVAPGSTFKIVTAAAALEAGLPTATPLAAGFAPPGGRWLGNAGGEVCGGSLVAAFAESCNSSFAQLGLASGAKRLGRLARRMGFDARPAVSGIPASTSAFGAPAGPDQLAATGIGQGTVVATPLAMALVTATVAADGLRPRPTLVDAACGFGRVPVARRRVLSPQIAGALRTAMRSVTLSGTGRAAASAPGSWALKTGTAEVPELRQAGTPAGTAGWIVGFPTDPSETGVVPVVAGVVLPDDQNANRSGPDDGAALVRAIAPAALAARASDDRCA